MGRFGLVGTARLQVRIARRKAGVQRLVSMIRPARLPVDQGQSENIPEEEEYCIKDRLIPDVNGDDVHLGNRRHWIRIGPTTGEEDRDREDGQQDSDHGAHDTHWAIERPLHLLDHHLVLLVVDRPQLRHRLVAIARGRRDRLQARFFKGWGVGN
jgi:hypothetical protein